MKKSSIEGAGLKCAKGDELPNYVDLTQTICNCLTDAGLVIADQDHK